MKIIENNIAVIVNINDNEKYINDTMVTLKRSFSNSVIVYVFSSISTLNKRQEVRTLCNSLDSNEFKIVLIENNFNISHDEQLKLINEKYIIFISHSVFFLIDDWYTKMIDYVVKLGQPYYSLGSCVSMFNRDAWLVAPKNTKRFSVQTVESYKAYLTR